VKFYKEARRKEIGFYLEKKALPKKLIFLAKVFAKQKSFS
jgi:hypothetical protein